MEEQFSLPVQYKGQDLHYDGRLVTYGYSYRIYIDVDGQEISFEPDEERNLRAVGDTQKASLSIELVRAVAESLEKHLR